MKPAPKRLLILTLFIASLAHAGKDVGNGGGAMVCRDPQGKILSAELLDLWEARALRKVKLNAFSPDLTAEELSEIALQKLRELASPDFANAAKQWLLHIRLHTQKISDLSPEAAISPPTDAKNGFFKRGCTLEGAASFNDLTGYLTVDDQIVSLMDPQNKAAHIVHEVIYKTLRESIFESFLPHDSVKARKITAMLFSDQNVKVTEMVESFLCKNSEFEVEVVPQVSAGTFKSRIHWKKFNGEVFSFENGSFGPLDMTPIETVNSNRSAGNFGHPILRSKFENYSLQILEFVGLNSEGREKTELQQSIPCTTSTL